MINVVTYNCSNITDLYFDKPDFWNSLKDFSYYGQMSTNQIENELINKNFNVILAVMGRNSIFMDNFINLILNSFPDIMVIIISDISDYSEIRSAFLAGIHDYILFDSLKGNLRNCLEHISSNQINTYFLYMLGNKIDVLAKHIFNGGDNVSEIVKDIIQTIYNDWENNPVVCQQIVELVKQKSYNLFVQKKPWLEKFIYRGDYIKEIGFALSGKEKNEQELIKYYSEVNILFKKYNVIDINNTIYAIGKSIIKQVDDKVTLQTVADDVFMNKSYISYIFKKMTDIRFNDFVIMVKIDRAKILLHYSDVSIGEVAEKLHFCNYGYFSSLFKKYSRMSPKEYKQLITHGYTPKDIDIYN